MFGLRAEKGASGTDPDNETLLSFGHRATLAKPRRPAAPGWPKPNEPHIRIFAFGSNRPV